MPDAERTAIEELDRRFRLGTAPVRQRVEHAVLGSDYGATSYTTVRQADELAARLRLGPDVSLLDLGAGTGFPGLHLAATTGCKVVLADRPAEGLRIAKQRAAKDGLIGRCAIVRCSGESLPFADATFDAVTHTDVLC